VRSIAVWEASIATARTIWLVGRERRGIVRDPEEQVGIHRPSGARFIGVVHREIHDHSSRVSVARERM
jgi:hypothetical protein